MIILLYLVFLCSNFLFIKSEGNGTMTINVEAQHNCTFNGSDYIFEEEQNVNLEVTSNKLFINHGRWQIINTNSSRAITFSFDLKTKSREGSKEIKPILHSSSIEKSMEGTWEFIFYYSMDVRDNLPRTTHDDGHNYRVSVCRTNVKIAPKPAAPSKYKMFFIIACAVGAILLTIIIAQTAYIIFLKNKARKLITLNTHNNLSKKTESVPNDTARYCSNPGQKMMKVADSEYDDNRDSVIYEAPNIEISGNKRMPMMQPPQPPDITTMPRTPRPDHNMRIGQQAMPRFQRQKLERELNVANRPPLPLPTQGYQSHLHPGFPHPGLAHPGLAHPDLPDSGYPHNDIYEEEYEEMETENTYKPPPIINTMPRRLPTPPKQVPTGNLLDVKENTLKMRQGRERQGQGNKPLLTPKPQQTRPNYMTANEFEQALRRRNNGANKMPKPNSGHMSPMQQELTMRRRPNGPQDSQTNELEEALRRRNNVDAKTNELEEALRRRNNGPPAALKSKPRLPPVPQPVQEEIYYNENQASSDEEWTYEPLKPLNSYDPNIYNI